MEPERGPSTTPGRQRRRTELSRQEALRRLGSVAIGRVVFTSQAMPAIRPVNHLLDQGRIIFRGYRDAAITAAASRERGTVVAYEADDIDPATHTGWSVIVTGLASIVTDPGQAAHYQAILRPWAEGELSQIISVEPELVTGFELTDD
jgi:nitroimidazol reductase NimA-like FMN-containing flavoprotein (pyridoxamine 5'-phosphate oxidase superfamily)